MILPKSTCHIDYATLKSGGVIMQKDDDFFAIRLRLPGGSISADQLPKIAEVAKRYGRGAVRLTARQGLEIPWISFEKIETARNELSQVGLALGPCGPRFRTVTACPGLPVCRFALADSQSFARQIDEKFSGMLLPHKFKATVSACPNACSKPLENELGFCAIVEPRLQAEACMGCGLCVEVCKEKALKMQDEKPALDRNRCVCCADCIQCCPSDDWKIERKGYAVFAGGKMGRHPELGEKIADFVDEELGMMIIWRCLDFYLQHGKKKERFGDLIRRVGLNEFKAAVLER
jgi:anaerobic sulfite reductase subunit C